MNRQLKFRIWDENRKMFLTYPCYLNHLDFNEFTCFDRFFKLNEEDCIVQEFTGLKDKNGKDIYEGDILYGELDTRDSFSGDLFIFKDFVVYEAPNFICKKADFPLDYYTSLEVIGNVFENPDMTSPNFSETNPAAFSPVS